MTRDSRTAGHIFMTKISRIKDKRSWKYIREYKLGRLAHRLSETCDRFRGKKHRA